MARSGKGSIHHEIKQLSMALGNAKTNGVYYTPEPVVRYIVERTLVPLLEDAQCDPAEVRILDPACGDGAFLTFAYRTLREHCSGRCSRDASASRPADELLQQVYGVDVDADAVAAARVSLARLSCHQRGPDHLEADGKPHEARALVAERRAATLRHGDALLDAAAGSVAPPSTAPAMAWNETFPEVFHRPNPGFDVVLGNPPYVNIRVITRSRGPAVKRYLQQRYRCAAGSYDLYVLFLELAYQLLRDGGRCGMIVPNKIAALDYARNCRALLLERTSLLEIVDTADLKLFRGAAVYPYIMIWEKRRASTRHRVSLIRAHSAEEQLQVTHRLRLPQSALSPETGWGLEAPLALEARAPCVPLGQYAELHSGTTGFVAHELGRWLVERDSAALAADVRAEKSGIDSEQPATNPVLEDASDQRGFAFIVSGNIDRYRIRPSPVRYMGHKFSQPLLRGECPLLSSRKRQLFRGRKIVLAGMCRRLEAAWDEGGHALGVQVFAVADPAEPFYLLGLLNSKLFSYLYRSRFEAKRLGSGFVSVNKGQLARLPVRSIQTDSACQQRERDAIVSRVAEVLALQWCLPTTAGQDADRITTRLQALDQQIDEIVFRLYCLTRPEIDRVERNIDLLALG